jgi:tetratricopeptide (TPR) repeat protein
MNLKLSGGHYDLTPPGSADIAQIVRHPAQVAQLRYTVDEQGEGLDDVLCNAARSGPDSLPLLQYCLQELYRQRTGDGELTHAAFHAMGGLEGAIGARAEQVISALGSAQIAALPHVLSQLVLVAEDESTVSSRRVPWSALRNDAENKLVQALVDAHLFVSDLQGGAPTFGIAHEALLRRWPRVVEWVEEHRQALQIRSRISAQANRWQDSGRKRDMLLPSGTQTNQAREILQQGGLGFSSQEQDFIQASLQSERRSERMRMAVMIVVASLALLAGVLGITARSAQTEAEAHRAEAEDLMGYMLGEFVEKLRPLGKLDLLDSISNRALSYLSNPARANDNDNTLAQRAKSLQLLSEVKTARGDPIGANTALLAGREILRRQLESRPSDIGLLKSTGENAFWLGQIHLDQKDWVKAKQYFEEYLHYANRQAIEAPNSIDAWVEQSYAHNNLGTVALRRGDIANAAIEFALSVDLKVKAYGLAPKGKQQASDLADTLSWQATAQARQGKLAQAEILYSQQLRLLQNLREDFPGETVWAKELATAWSRQSELKQALGDLTASHQSAQEALKLLESSVGIDPSNRNWQRGLSVAELRLVDVELNLGKSLQVLPRLNDIEQRLIELIRLEPKRGNLQALQAITQRYKADALMRGRQATAATAPAQKSLALLSQLHQTNSSDLIVLSALAETLLLNAEIAAASNNGDISTHCQTVRTILRPVINDTNDFHILASWVKAHACLSLSNEVSTAKNKLESMSYRDVNYLQYLSTHPAKKATS